MKTADEMQRTLVSFYRRQRIIQILKSIFS
jgi:hypothetical protein